MRRLFTFTLTNGVYKFRFDVEHIGNNFKVQLIDKKSIKKRILNHTFVCESSEVAINKMGEMFINNWTPIKL